MEDSADVLFKFVRLARVSTTLLTCRSGYYFYGRHENFLPPSSTPWRAQGFLPPSSTPWRPRRIRRTAAERPHGTIGPGRSGNGNSAVSGPNSTAALH